MVQTNVYGADGKATGTVTLDDEVFGIEPNVPVMHEVVTAQLAAVRSGTAKTKTRGEVRGGGRKPWRQKGTGRARQGSIRAPQWTGGGIVHGPTGEQNHRKRVNKKVRRLALRSALSDRAGADDVRVVEDLAFDAPRTKDAVAFLDALGLSGQRVLLVVAARSEAVDKSFRNLGERIQILPVGQLNTHAVLVSDVVVVERSALPAVGRPAAAAVSEEVAT